MSAPPAARAAPLGRDAFRVFRPVQTRWGDNDAYGHLNNVVYYAYFDSAVNAWLVERGVLAIADSPVVGLVAETGCTYFAPASFPEPLETGLAVARLGTASVEYRIGVFRPGAGAAIAQGRFVHVYVDRETGRPAPIPAAARAAMESIAASP